MYLHEITQGDVTTGVAEKNNSTERKRKWMPLNGRLESPDKKGAHLPPTLLSASSVIDMNKKSQFPIDYLENVQMPKTKSPSLFFPI